MERASGLNELPAHRWCTTQAPAGPIVRLLHGWGALGGLLLQLVAAHCTAIKDTHVRNALDALTASTLNNVLRSDRIQDRYFTALSF